MTNTKEPKLPTGLSPSSIDLWSQCPKRFEWEKIKGMRSFPGPEAVLGTFVHLILEHVMQEDPKNRTLEIARAIAGDKWTHFSNRGDFTGLRLSPEAVSKFKWDAWTSVENYFKMEPPETVEVVATEKRVSAIVEDIPFRGIIDRLDREGEDLVVSDYKNGKVGDPKYHGAKRDQLNIYAAMVEATTGERPARGRLIFTAHSEFLNVDFTDESQGAVIEKAQNVWTKLHENFAATDYSSKEPSHFPTKTGPLCAWCPALSKCPEGKAMVTMLRNKGRLRKDSPGYAVVSKTSVRRMPRRK